MKLPFIVRVVIVVILAVTLSEVAPEITNAILFLVFIGILLANYKKFSGLFVSLGGK